MTARFLYVIGTLRAGGSERQLLYLVRALRRGGHDVTVAVWNYSDSDVYVEPIRATGATVLPMDAPTRGAKFLSLRRLLRAQKFDVVHSFSFYLNAIVAAAAARTGTLSIGCVRSTLALATGESGPFLGRVSARWPVRQVYNNTFAEREAKARRWWRPHQVAVVPNHLDVEGYPDTDVPRTRTIAGIGSLLEVKRWDRLIELAACLRDRGVDARVVIAGEGTSRAELEADIARRNLADRVTLLGYVSDVKQVLADCAFLVHTSRSEGSPNVIIEALAAGRPVIATDVGDVARLVRDGETGFVVPFGDEVTLCDRAMLLLSDYERCAAMGRRAREVARERFGAMSLAHETIAAYRSLGWTS